MRRYIGVLGLAVLLATMSRGAAPPVKGSRGFTPEQQVWLVRNVAQIEGHALAGRFAQAESLEREALALRERIQGRDYWQTRDLRLQVQRWQALAKPSVAQQRAAGRTFEISNRANQLLGQGRDREAENLFRESLALRRKELGEEHPETAVNYLNVAECLIAQSQYAEALAVSQKALAIFKKARGEEHPSTAIGYNNAAQCLQYQGKHGEALPLSQKALRISEKTLGEIHPETANCASTLASCLQALGEPARAQPLLEKALLIRTKALGEEHLDTANSYNNLANCLLERGLAARAQPLFEKALATCNKALGEGHPYTALSCGNLADCLDAQGKSAQALPLQEKALAIRLKVLGEEHPDTALSYNNLALCLQAQGKAAQALPLFQKALATFRKVLGEEHPTTATGYGNVGTCLNRLGKPAQAQPLYEKALAIRKKTLGEDHPETATSTNNLATCLWSLKRQREAVRLWQGSLPGQEAARFHVAPTGFDRAGAAGRYYSPHTLLAVGLALLKQPNNAFRHAEASLARGLLDDLASGGSNENVARLETLKARLAKLDAAIVAGAGREGTQEQRSRQDALVKERRTVTAEMARLATTVSERQVLPRDRIQQAIRPDEALLLWVDALGEVMACVLRREGKPVWARLQGTGEDGSWTQDDFALTGRLYEALVDPASSDAECRKLLAAYRVQYLDPLAPLLRGVKRLLVVPSRGMAYIPVEALTTDHAVGYVPSGSVLARLVEKHRAVDGSSLLAVGDPVFDRAAPPEPPASGVFIKAVLPGSHAAKAGLQPGDILLSIGTTDLDSFEDLQGALADLPARARIWRDGKTFVTRLQGSPLGGVFDQRSARAAARAWRRERESVVTRGTAPKRLPGTRLEVEAIAPLVKGSTMLLGSDASEQMLDALQAQGKLKAFRLIHIATHGKTDEDQPGRSAVILAQDKLPDPLAQVNAGRHPYDGRLTVSRIRETWTLDADLVVLSACETGLGRDADGDGLLGFAQAFLSRGARSVVLSRWKVDDGATALLMIRFYENLLGKRKGLNKPLGRAAALDEAKKWLRSLPRKDAERLATLHSGGVLRGSEGVEKLPGKAKPVELKGDQPFAHPYYWAAFTLVGDPD